MSARKQSRRARFAAFARRERASNLQIRWWLAPTPPETERAKEFLALMDDAKMQMLEACGIQPAALLGFDFAKPGGDRSVVMWARRNGKATIIEAIKEFECSAQT